MPRSKKFGKEMRIKYANERKATRELLTSKDQIAKLDKMFGLNLGAVKERSRLNKIILEEDRVIKQTTTKKLKTNAKKKGKVRRY
jgi:hypothetical protein